MRTAWRETLSAATDLALVGIAVTAAAVPLVTAGAAVRTGSVAVRHFVDHGYLPGGAALAGTFRRSLGPGLLAGGAVLATAAVFALNIGALRAGRVPGGAPALVATGLAAAVLVAITALAAVRLGRDPASSWRSALRWAGRAATRAPGAAAAVVGVVAAAVVLGLFVPVTLPLLVGYTLFALHVVADRLAGDESPE